MVKRKRQLVVIESGPTDMMAKICNVLKKKGYETVLITLLGNTSGKFLRESYDKIINLDFKFFKANIKNLPGIVSYGLKKSSGLFSAYREMSKLRPYMVIGRSTPNWLCYVTKSYFRNSPFVYFPYDIRSFGYENWDEVRKGKTPAWEIKAERYCFENSDGIIHKGDENELETLEGEVLGRNIKLNSPIIHFSPYCLKELEAPMNKKKKLSYKDKGTHLVFVGDIARNKEWADCVKAVLDEGIHLHLYGKTVYFSSEDSSDVSKKKYSDMMNSKFFHIHKSVDQKNLAKEIAKYDYGIWIGWYNETRKSTRLITGNKFASYLEAGIPTIYFDNHEYLNKKIMGKYGAGLGVSFAQLKKLKSVLKKHNYNKFVKNIKKAREDYEMNKQVPRLEKFFEAVVKYRRNKNH